MRMEDITNVLCLSCALMFFYVSSQPSCNPGWFGHQCKYKCRCFNNSCDVNGSCTTPYTCGGRWFGPACQYADLAYFTSHLTAVTDGNDSTCNVPNAGDSIMITLNDSIIFTWLRIHVRDQGSGALESLSVTLLSNTTSVPCPVWRKHAVDKTILDMHCNLSQTINNITLTGQAVPNLCSVYVSGGRNVALKETTSQGSVYTIPGTTHQLDASRAVDGNTHPSLGVLSCTHTYGTTSWTLTLSRPRSVHRYAMYNRDSMRTRLVGFQLESFDSMNRSVFVYNDRTTILTMRYSFIHSPLLVQMVVVTVNNSENILSLCEVEIYGDSVCDAQHYGRDCEHSCSCLNNEACFISTGACPSGCPTGFFGESCLGVCPAGKIGNYCNLTCSDNCLPLQSENISACDNNGACQTQCKDGFTGSSCDEKCELETFGLNCNESCSPSCAPSGHADVSSCDTKTGDCLKGCQSGFSGASCQDNCSVGTFGKNCNESCSPNCAPSGQTGVSSCDNKTGVCLKGCQSGFSGASCQDGAPSAVVATHTSVPMELILGLCGLFAALVVLAVCLRRKENPRQAAESADLNVQNE